MMALRAIMNQKPSRKASEVPKAGVNKIKVAVVWVDLEPQQLYESNNYHGIPPPPDPNRPRSPSPNYVVGEAEAFKSKTTSVIFETTSSK